MVVSGGKKTVPLSLQRVPSRRGSSPTVNQPSMAAFRVLDMVVSFRPNVICPFLTIRQTRGVNLARGGSFGSIPLDPRRVGS